MSFLYGLGASFDAGVSLWGSVSLERTDIHTTEEKFSDDDLDEYNYQKTADQPIHESKKTAKISLFSSVAGTELWPQTNIGSDEEGSSEEVSDESASDDSESSEETATPSVTILGKRPRADGAEELDDRCAKKQKLNNYTQIQLGTKNYTSSTSFVIPPTPQSLIPCLPMNAPFPPYALCLKIYDLNKNFRKDLSDFARAPEFLTQHIQKETTKKRRKAITEICQHYSRTQQKLSLQKLCEIFHMRPDNMLKNCIRPLLKDAVLVEIPSADGILARTQYKV